MTMEQAQNNGNSNNQNQNPNAGQAGGNQYTEEDIRNLQAFGTIANQDKINLAKKLAQKDPNELLDMETTLQNKVIKDIWWYENLDELKIMLPAVFESKEDRKWADDEDGLKRQLELMKYQFTKDKINSTIKQKISELKVPDTIQDIETKIKTKMKLLSSDIETDNAVEIAIKLVLSEEKVDIDPMTAFISRTTIKSEKPSNDEDLNAKKENLRKILWMKGKN